MADKYWDRPNWNDTVKSVTAESMTAETLEVDGSDVDADDLDKLAAVTATATELNKLAGVTAGAAAASKALVLDANRDATGIHKLGFTQEVENAAVVRETKSANYTLTEADSGQIVDVDTDNVVITLPATVVGMCFEIRNAAGDGLAKISLSPNASDKIMGAGFTSADDKDAINTKATAKKGDRIKVVGDGVNGWYVAGMVGIWARE